MHVGPDLGTVCVFFPEGGLGLRLVRGAADGPRFEYLELQRWRIRFAGELFQVHDPTLVPMYWDLGLFDLPRRRVELDLTFEGAQPMPDRRGYRQPGRVHGAVEGAAAHARWPGPRDWTPSFSASFDDALVTTRGSAHVVRSVALPLRRGGRVLMLEEGYARFESNGRVGYGPVEIVQPLERGLAPGF